MRSCLPSARGSPISYLFAEKRPQQSVCLDCCGFSIMQGCALLQPCMAKAADCPMAALPYFRMPVQKATGIRENLSNDTSPPLSTTQKGFASCILCWHCSSDSGLT